MSCSPCVIARTPLWDDHADASKFETETRLVTWLARKKWRHADRGNQAHQGIALGFRSLALAKSSLTQTDQVFF